MPALDAPPSLRYHTPTGRLGGSTVPPPDGRDGEGSIDSFGGFVSELLGFMGVVG